MNIIDKLYMKMAQKIIFQIFPFQIFPIFCDPQVLPLYVIQ